MKFKVLGLDVPVIAQALDGIHDGWFLPETKEILVDESASDETKYETALHEVGHAFCYRSGLSQVLNEQTEEMFCELLSSFIKDNFDLKR